MTTPDQREATDPTRGEDVERDEQRTDPTAGISAKDPSRRAPDPTDPRAPEQDEPAAEEEEPGS
jgi:hypothetical protein